MNATKMRSSIDISKRAANMGRELIPMFRRLLMHANANDLDSLDLANLPVWAQEVFAGSDFTPQQYLQFLAFGKELLNFLNGQAPALRPPNEALRVTWQIVLNRVSDA